MHRKVSLFVSIIVVAAAILLSSFGSIMAYKTWSKTEEKQGAGQTSSSDGIDVEQISKEMNDIKQYIDTYYIGEIDPETVKDAALYGFVAGLGDKYGGYYNKEAYDDLMADLDGDMQGIGISVIFNADMQGIEVIDVFPDSPAMEAGVEPGDVIMFCGEDLESVASLGYEAALTKLRGKAGTVAEFVVYRGENYTEEVEFSIKRDYVTEQSVKYRLYEADGTIGIIKISSFNTATVEQFSQALSALSSMGAEKLIFDVRNNPGGELQSICHILDFLLPEGPVIRTIDKSGTEKIVYTSDENEIDMPMAVITNGGTASAAELFTSALKDYEKAVVVGENTYGKGCMQSMFTLPNGGCVKLTSALYCPPFSENYDGVGIKPDVEVSLSEEASSKSIYKLTDSEDDQLIAAAEAISGD